MFFTLNRFTLQLNMLKEKPRQTAAGVFDVALPMGGPAEFFTLPRACSLRSTAIQVGRTRQCSASRV